MALQHVVQIGRPSAIGSELSSSMVGPMNQSMTRDDKSQLSNNEFPMQVEEEEEEEEAFEQGGIPFDESAEFQPIDSSLVSTDDINIGTKRKSDMMDGLELGLSNDITQEEEQGGGGGGNDPQNQQQQQPEDKQQANKKKSQKKKSNLKGPQRLRKRRRVEIDNDATELTSDFIKDMLRDTSDIVQQNRTHPADYNPNKTETSLPSSENVPFKSVDSLKHDVMVQIMAAHLPYEVLLGRPNCADNGGVHPKLLLVWERNFSRVHGKPLPFQMRGEAGQEQRRDRKKQTKENEEDDDDEDASQESQAQDEEDIELGRHRDGSLGEAAIGEGRLSMDFLGEKIMEEEEEGVEFPSTQHDQDDRDFPLQEEEEEESPVDHSGADFTLDLPAGMDQSPIPSDRSDRSATFSLGAVNDLEEAADLMEEPRQDGLQDETATSSTKWHKHTVKVLELLKRNMPVNDNDTDNDDDEQNEDNNVGSKQQLSYDKLSYGTSRRTACGVFFELLQLKTWDFIELEQESSFGDILIKPGKRFHEQPPIE